MQPLTLVAVFAQDWAAFCEQSSADEEFKPVYGWVCGVLIQEDDKQIVIAHHYFTESEPNNQVRHVTCIPKVCVERRQEFRLEEAP